MKKFHIWGYILKNHRQMEWNLWKKNRMNRPDRVFSLATHIAAVIVGKILSLLAICFLFYKMGIIMLYALVAAWNIKDFSHASHCKFEKLLLFSDYTWAKLKKSKDFFFPAYSKRVEFERKQFLQTWDLFSPYWTKAVFAHLYKFNYGSICWILSMCSNLN